MSLKLCCFIPRTLNCLKSSRSLLLAPECTQLSINPLKTINLCRNIQQYRCLSTDNLKQKTGNPIKDVYYGTLTPQIKAIKFFSLSSSVVGLIAQPWLYQEIVSTANVPVIVAAYSFIGFFTFLTPIMLHFITKKYIIQLCYNEKTDTYIAKTVNFFCRTKETEFKVDDINVPDVPGMFTTFHVKGKALFVDPRQFDQPNHYAKIMGFDKPIDFKLNENVTSELKGDRVAVDSSRNSNK